MGSTTTITETSIEIESSAPEARLWFTPLTDEDNANLSAAGEEVGLEPEWDDEKEKLFYDLQDTSSAEILHELREALNNNNVRGQWDVVRKAL